MLEAYRQLLIALKVAVISLSVLLFGSAVVEIEPVLFGEVVEESFGAVDSIPINIGTTRALDVLSDRVVDFEDRGSYVKFSYYTDEVPPLNEGEDITLRKNNSWTKTVGVDKFGTTLGKQEGETTTEFTIFSGNRWVWDDDRNNPNAWRYLAFATTTQANFNRTDARTRVLQFRLTGQAGINNHESILSIIFGRYAFADDFFPDADPESTSFDGFCRNNPGSSSWDTVHDGTSCNESDDTDNNLSARIDKTGAGNFAIRRTMIVFDTSGVSPSTISAATLSLWFIAKSNGDNDGDDFLAIVDAPSAASVTSMIAADFDLIGDAVDDPTEMHDTGERKDITSLDATDTVYTVWTFNATGVGQVNTAAVTKLGMREGHDILDNPYAGSNGTNNNGAPSAADKGTNPPKLVLTLVTVATGFNTIYH